MNVNLILVKIKQRLNKLDSNDYDNLECWQFVEAFNKAQRDWVRRQLHGGNLYREGDEQTKRRMDDLQILLTTKDLQVTKRGSDIFSTEDIPSDYLEYKRLDVKASVECSDKKLSLTSDLAEEANVNEYKSDAFLKPSLEWRETFHTLRGNRIYIYSDGTFDISDAVLTYYRQPLDISLDNCQDIEGNNNGDVNPEFKDDIVEVLIDEAVSILASDIESFNQKTLADNRVTKNN
jgi:hypothetical protein